MKDLVYILAASHSGSTLLSMLLGSHPQIATIGELKLSAMGKIESYRCSCGKPILECEFWEKVKENMKIQGFDFDLTNAGTDYRYTESAYANRLLAPTLKGRLLENIRDIALYFSPTWRSQLPQIHKRNAALVSTIATLQNAQIVVDSSKTSTRLKYLLRNPHLNVKVIHLLRDGRAASLTYMDTERFADAKEQTLRKGGSGANREYERLSINEAAYTWCRIKKEAEHILKYVDKSQWIQIKYEDICTHTDESLGMIFKFLGLDPSVRVKDFRSVEHHVIGNGMRLDSTSEVKLDERWKSVLTKEQLQTFDVTAGITNRKYEYY